MFGRFRDVLSARRNLTEPSCSSCCKTAAVYRWRRLGDRGDQSGANLRGVLVQLCSALAAIHNLLERTSLSGWNVVGCGYRLSWTYWLARLADVASSQRSALQLASHWSADLDPRFCQPWKAPMVDRRRIQHSRAFGRDGHKRKCDWRPRCSRKSMTATGARTSQFSHEQRMYLCHPLGERMHAGVCPKTFVTRRPGGPPSAQLLPRISRLRAFAPALTMSRRH
mmetsp:Transcript_46121/g.128265  ORF Transcript_46121/g.128265 Transcript_46121/m.128265 type:complete len:224 (-) Transcript_46121:648-1319(-)